MDFHDEFFNQRLSRNIFSSYYKDFLKFLYKALLFSRLPLLRRNKTFILHIQFRLANFLDGCFAAIKEGKVEAKKLKVKIGEETNKDAKSELIEALDGIQTRFFAHKNLARIAKYIADGIAWRKLNYDRSVIRLLSSNRRTVSINVNEPGFKGVLNVARGLTAQHRSCVIINDLTNFIRIGDLTEIYKKSVYIHECKQKGKRIRNIFTLLHDIKKVNNIGRQSDQLLTAQTAITHRVIIVNSKQTVRIKEIDIPFHDFLKDIKRVISKANKNGYSSKLISSYLSVSCLNLKELIQQKKVEEWKKFQRADNWDDKDFVVPFTNTDTFYKNEDFFIPNWTPYSIFPFSAKMCLGLLSGNLILTALLNLSNLYEYFRENGWEVEGLSEGQFIRRYDPGLPLVPNMETAYQYDETLCVLKRGAFHLAIPATWIFRIGMDFVSPKTILLEAEKIFHEAVPPQSDMVAINITREKKVWK